MITMLKCKCICGVMWTRAIAAGIMTFITFTLLDPGEVVDALALAIDPVMFRIKAYAGGFFFFWFTFNTATYLSYYFAELQAQEKRELEKLEKEKAAQTTDSTQQ